MRYQLPATDSGTWGWFSQCATSRMHDQQQHCRGRGLLTHWPQVWSHVREACLCSLVRRGGHGGRRILRGPWGFGCPREGLRGSRSGGCRWWRGRGWRLLICLEFMLSFGIVIVLCVWTFCDCTLPWTQLHWLKWFSYGYCVVRNNSAKLACNLLWTSRIDFVSLKCVCSIFIDVSCGFSVPAVCFGFKHVKFQYPTTGCLMLLFLSFDSFHIMWVGWLWLENIFYFYELMKIFFDYSFDTKNTGLFKLTSWW